MTSTDVLSPVLTDNRGLDGADREQQTDFLVEKLAHCRSRTAERPLRNELIRVNMPVAASIAGRYRSRGIPREDLCQVAYLALTKAAFRFDAHRGHAFLTYCVPSIRGEVRRHFRDRGWMVRPPRRLQELQQNLLSVRADMSLELGRPPTQQELAERVEASVDDVREALDGRGAFSPASLDRPTGEPGDGVPLGELLPDEDAGLPAAEARVVLAPVVRRLSERDQRILRLRFFDDLTQQEIAEDIGVTQMQVSRLLTRIFRDLRAEIGEADEPA